MRIEAINNTMNCQPIRAIEFGRRENAPVIVEEPIIAQDTFVAPATTEQKYNFACLLAAYYKTQYENLLKNGCCEA